MAWSAASRALTFPELVEMILEHALERSPPSEWQLNRETARAVRATNRTWRDFTDARLVRQTTAEALGASGVPMSKLYCEIDPPCSAAFEQLAARGSGPSASPRLNCTSPDLLHTCANYTSAISPVSRWHMHGLPWSCPICHRYTLTAVSVCRTLLPDSKCGSSWPPFCRSTAYLCSLVGMVTL